MNFRYCLDCEPSLRRWLISVSILFVLAAAAKAELPAEQREFIEQRATEEISRQGIPGLSVAVAVENALQYEAGFGQADVENAVPAPRGYLVSDGVDRQADHVDGCDAAGRGGEA